MVFNCFYGGLACGAEEESWKSAKSHKILRLTGAALLILGRLKHGPRFRRLSLFVHDDFLEVPGRPSNSDPIHSLTTRAFLVKAAIPCRSSVHLWQQHITFNDCLRSRIQISQRCRDRLRPA